VVKGQNITAQGQLEECHPGKQCNDQLSIGFVAQIRNKLKMLMFKTINPNSDAVRTVWII
jgi:hypothetical protein